MHDIVLDAVGRPEIHVLDEEALGLLQVRRAQYDMAETLDPGVGRSEGLSGRVHADIEFERCPHDRIGDPEGFAEAEGLCLCV